jgi:hypothetical protein
MSRTHIIEDSHQGRRHSIIWGQSLWPKFQIAKRGIWASGTLNAVASAYAVRKNHLTHPLFDTDRIRQHRGHPGTMPRRL